MASSSGSGQRAGDRRVKKREEEIARAGKLAGVGEAERERLRRAALAEGFEARAEGREAAEVRRKVLEALEAREGEEAGAEVDGGIRRISLDAVGAADLGVVRAELEAVRREFAESEVKLCSEGMVALEFRRTAVVHLVAKLTFGDGYPRRALFLELASHGGLHPDLVAKLAQGIDAANAERAGAGEPQVVATLDAVRQLADGNRLAPCFDEVRRLARDKILHTLKPLQAKGVLRFTCTCGLYRLDAQLTVPRDYPAEAPELEVTGGNFPPLYNTLFLFHAREHARKLRCRDGRQDLPVECVYEMVAFLARECVGRVPRERCQLCGEPLFPADAADLDAVLASKHEKKKRVERLYCGHYLPWGCLDTFLTTPPFDGDFKRCPMRGCAKPIHHPDWPDDIKLLEKRWSTGQMRRQELADVQDAFSDFL